jgi:hypothetical protein
LTPSITPKIRGSLTKAVLLLKSITPRTLSSPVMLRAKAATSHCPSLPE